MVCQKYPETDFQVLQTWFKTDFWILYKLKNTWTIEWEIIKKGWSAISNLKDIEYVMKDFKKID